MNKTYEEITADQKLAEEFHNGIMAILYALDRVYPPDYWLGERERIADEFFAWYEGMQSMITWREGMRLAQFQALTTKTLPWERYACKDE